MNNESKDVNGECVRLLNVCMIRKHQDIEHSMYVQLHLFNMRRKGATSKYIDGVRNRVV
jgi:hypothetical protein